MLRANSCLALGRRPLRRFACWCAAGFLMLPVGCQVNLPMERLLLNGPPTPGPWSSGLTPPLNLTVSAESDDESTGVKRTAYRAQADDRTLPEPDTIPVAPSSSALPSPTVVVHFDFVLRQTFEQNGEILLARERVRESEAALDAAMSSCLPQALRKDTFKKSVAEATVWRRRAELRKIENEKLQDAANTYFDWLTAQRGEAVARDFIPFEEKLLTRARKLVELGEKPAQVMIESAETALNGYHQSVLDMHQKSEAASFKLAYLMGMNGGMPATNEILEPIDRVNISKPLELWVRQAQDNGPGVRELQGLVASIQQGIEQARLAQRLCALNDATLVCGRLHLVHTPLTCGHLQMARSELQQAQLSLLSLHSKLAAGIEEAYSAILSGHEQISRAADAIPHAAETYRLLDVRLTKENPETSTRNNTYNAIQSSIQQLSLAHANYLKAIDGYNKAQARLLLLVGSYNQCPGKIP